MLKKEQKKEVITDLFIVSLQVNGIINYQEILKNIQGAQFS